MAQAQDPATVARDCSKVTNANERHECIWEAIVGIQKKFEEHTSTIKAAIEAAGGKADVVKAAVDAAATKVEQAIRDLQRDNQACCNRLAQALEDLKKEMEKQREPRIGKACTLVYQHAEESRQTTNRFFHVHNNADWTECEELLNTVHVEKYVPYRIKFHCVKSSGPISAGLPVPDNLPSLATPYVTTGREEHVPRTNPNPDDVFPHGAENFCGWRS